MKTQNCSRCGKIIDKSDAQERFTSSTRVGICDLGEAYKKRILLCNLCTLEFDIFLLIKEEVY